jgi:tryptophan synthase alpha chain
MPAPSRIDQVFTRLRDAGHMAFMPFITAGDPDVATTGQLIELLADAGVDLIEVGFPYSDPIADGPVIQASYQRALTKGLRVADIFATVRELTSRRQNLPPLVGMVAYSIIFRLGADKFLADAKAAGFSGLIVPDYPADEAAEFAKMVVAHGLDPVQLIAPTTTTARTDTILETSRGFLYCISVAGTTGTRRELPEALRTQLKDLRSRTKLPLAVGFGVSLPEQVRELRGLADGVIVGSAIVKGVGSITEQGRSPSEAFAEIRTLVDGMLTATRGG